MNNIDNREQIAEEYKNIKYILTSSMRSMLLLTLYDKSKNLDELRKEMKKPSATILHGLKQLITIKLVKKSSKCYKLTSNGILLTANMIKLIENWNSINENKMFWNTHDLSDIPEYLLKNIYLLKNAVYVTSTTSDLSNAFNTYIKLISESKKLKMILPIYSENHFRHLITLLNKNQIEHIDLIINEEILEAMKRNDFFNDTLIENEKIEIKSVKKDLKIFLTYSNEFMSLTLFFNDGHYDDSQMLIAKDEDALKWASLLYHKF